MSRVEARLQDLGLSLAPPKPPVANYLGTKRSGDLLFVAGRVSRLRGAVGAEVTTETARAGRHARTATGAAQLPFGAAVQLDMVLRLAPA